MNAEQLKGTWTQFKGDLKETWGDISHHDLLQIAGNYDRLVEKVQERYGDQKDELMKWASKWHEPSPPAVVAKKPRQPKKDS